MENNNYHRSEAASFRANSPVSDDVNSHISGRKFPTLSPVQVDVMSLCMGGMNSREIGLELGMSIKAVEDQRSRILGLLGARNTVEASAKYYLYLKNDHQRMGEADKAQILDEISPRELDVLNLVVTGFISTEIAETLTLKPKTVENHRYNINNKLGVRKSSEAIRVALENGIIDESIVNPPPVIEIPQSKETQLSIRELEVVQHVAMGFNAKQIAAKLNLSMKTVENHTARIREKLDAKNTTEAIVKYIVSNNLGLEQVVDLFIDKDSYPFRLYNEISSRVREVIELTAYGYSSKEVGVMLKISPKTAENHKSRILGDFAANNMSEVVVKSIAMGVLSLADIKAKYAEKDQAKDGIEAFDPTLHKIDLNQVLTYSAD